MNPLAQPARAANSTDLQTRSDHVSEGVLSGLQTAEALVQSAMAAGGEAHSPAAPDEVELTIVIPVYNEPKTVLQIIRAVQQLPISKQIVVVNDGSRDGTAEALQPARTWEGVEVLEHAENRGKGAALQTGFQHARGRFVIVQDADLEYNPEDILKVIAPLQAGECQVVFGSRYLEFAEQDPSRLHRFGNWALTAMSNLLTGQKLTDMETCYKAFSRDVLKSIPIEQCRFGFEPEITAKVARKGIKIREVGVRYHCRSRLEGKKIGVRDLFAAIYCIVRYSLFG
jgi:glycosyltransferase involved in cell wall biosynthesis